MKTASFACSTYTRTLLVRNVRISKVGFPFEQSPSLARATLRFFGPSARDLTGLSQLFAVISSLTDLPIAKPDLESHTNEASNANTTGIADSGCSQRKLAVFLG